MLAAYLKLHCHYWKLKISTIMKVIIIEDEQFAYEKLALMLSKVDDTIDIIGHAKSISEAVELIEQNHDIDLAFFDIQLADGLSFSIFDRVEVGFPIIFTTAFDHHAIRAFKHNSIDYLLKPIPIAELSQSLEKYKKLWRPNNSAVANLIDEIKQLQPKATKERFTVKVGEHIKMIKTEEISCFYSFDKGTFIQTKENRNYLIDYSLDDLSGLIDTGKFYRVNRKYIVNIDFIRDMIAYTNSRLKLVMEPQAEDDIIVSRERVRSFKVWLEQ